MVEAFAGGEPVDGFFGVPAACDDDEVDGAASGSGGEAGEAFDAVVVGEDAHGWRPPGSGVIGYGAGPGSGAAVAAAPSDNVIGQLGEIDASQELVTVDHDSRRRFRRL